MNEGERFFGVAAHYDAQVTFVAWEVFCALQTEFGRDDWSPVAMRRNIVLAGVALIPSSFAVRRGAAAHAGEP